MTGVRIAFVAGVLAAIAAGIACGSSSDDAPPPATQTKSVPEASVDDDTGAPFVMAAHPAAPQVVNAGGAGLAKPVIVPIFFPSFAYPAQVIDFASKLTGSPYWKAPTSE